MRRSGSWKSNLPKQANQEGKRTEIQAAKFIKVDLNQCSTFSTTYFIYIELHFPLNGPHLDGLIQSMYHCWQSSFSCWRAAGEYDDNDNETRASVEL